MTNEIKTHMVKYSFVKKLVEENEAELYNLVMSIEKDTISDIKQKLKIYYKNNSRRFRDFL